MKNISSLFILFFSCIVLIISCSKKDQDPVSPVLKKAPVANAGFDRIFAIPTNDVELMGSGKDLDGYIVSYQWTQLAGPSGMVLSNPASPVSKVNLPEFGQYILELKVKDNDGLIGADIMTILVDSTVNLNDPCLGCWDY